MSTEGVKVTKKIMTVKFEADLPEFSRFEHHIVAERRRARRNEGNTRRQGGTS
jgi:hypothetical protein